MLVFGQEGLQVAMGNTCAGVSSRAVWKGRRGGDLPLKRKGKQEGGIKPVRKATMSSPFTAKKWRSKEISYSNVCCPLNVNTHVLVALSPSLRLNLRGRHISWDHQNYIYIFMLEKRQWKAEFRNMTSTFSYVSQWYFCAYNICPPKFSDVPNLNKGILFQYHNIWVKIWLSCDNCRTYFWT